MNTIVAHLPVLGIILLPVALAALGGYVAARKDRARALGNKARADAKNKLWRIEIRRGAATWSARVVGDGYAEVRHSLGAAVEAALRDFEARQGRPL